MVNDPGQNVKCLDDFEVAAVSTKKNVCYAQSLRCRLVLDRGGACFIDIVKLLLAVGD